MDGRENIHYERVNTKPERKGQHHSSHLWMFALN